METNHNGRARYLWLILGVASLLLGIIGAVLPLLPTTPFVLLAAFAFARSSPRLQHWLETNPQFGPLIDNWRRHGAISTRAKTYSVAAMAATPVVSYSMSIPTWALLAQIAVLAGSATFVLTRPSGPRVRPEGL